MVLKMNIENLKVKITIARSFFLPIIALLIFFSIVWLLIHKKWEIVKMIYVKDFKEQIARDFSKRLIFEDYFLLVVGNTHCKSINVYHKVFDDIDSPNVYADYNTALKALKNYIKNNFEMNPESTWYGVK